MRSSSAAGLVCLAGIAALTACGGGGGSGPHPTPTPSSSALMYVADSGNNAIYEFPRNAKGVALPATTIQGGATLLNAPFPIAVDSLGNIWVGNTSPAEILEFSPAATGNAAPAAIMTISSQGIPGAQPIAGLTFDATGNMYVATGPDNQLFVYASPGNGTPVPTRAIGGIATQINIAQGVAVDANGDIYTASTGSNAILVFGPSANGNVAPIRVIAGTHNTLLDAPSYVAVDSAGDVFALNAGSIITEYAPGASGDVAPIAKISQPSMGGQITFDTSDNLYVGAINNNPGAVLVYPPPISNGSKPNQLLQSPVFSAPTGVFAP
ncbi:MAG TPA: NHL repeat-containing protein [Candidatus Baltobacteraceae bacterium]|nr:NHL repeat-containing protein [Candidatus Baltobacteraceae bacterium]